MDLIPLDSLFPEFYQRFLPAFFQNTIPEETSAVCSDCAMLPQQKGAPVTSNGKYFSHRSKCCTHYPNLPNYLVGAILDSDDSTLNEGRQRIVETINKGVAVTPQGLERPSKYSVLLKNSQADFFGKSASLICPFFNAEKGLCTLWPFVNATCRTWFCKYDRGHAGMEFWRAMKRYMEHLQERLVRYALFEAGFDLKIIIKPKDQKQPMTVEELDDRPLTPEDYQQLWSEWRGGEIEYYRHAFNLIAELTPEKMKDITGITHTILLEELKSTYHLLMRNEPPEKLIRNSELMVEKSGNGTYLLTSYNVFDQVEVSARLYEMLDHFDGRQSNDVVISELLKEGKAVPDSEMLLSLYHLKVLISAE